MAPSLPLHIIQRLAHHWSSATIKPNHPCKSHPLSNDHLSTSSRPTHRDQPPHMQLCDKCYTLTSFVIDHTCSESWLFPLFSTLVLTHNVTRSKSWHLPSVHRNQFQQFGVPMEGRAWMFTREFVLHKHPIVSNRISHPTTPPPNSQRGTPRWIVDGHFQNNDAHDGKTPQ